LGGWICAYVGRVPLTGEIITHPGGWTFEIRQANPRQVHQIALLQTPVDANEEIKSHSE
jgi:magnesium and cobalt transporter